MADRWGFGMLRMSDDERRAAHFGVRHCASLACVDPVQFWVSWSYDSEVRGGVQVCRKMLCPVHAARFAETHGLEAPIVDGVDVTANLW